MALGQFLQALTQFGQQPSLGQHFLAGQEQGRQLEDRELERRRLEQQIASEEQLAPYELLKAQREAEFAGQPAPTAMQKNFQFLVQQGWPEGMALDTVTGNNVIVQTDQGPQIYNKRLGRYLNQKESSIAQSAYQSTGMAPPPATAKEAAQAGGVETAASLGDTRSQATKPKTSLEIQREKEVREEQRKQEELEAKQQGALKKQVTEISERAEKNRIPQLETQLDKVQNKWADTMPGEAPEGTGLFDRIISMEAPILKRWLGTQEGQDAIQDMQVLYNEVYKAYAGTAVSGSEELRQLRALGGSTWDTPEAIQRGIQAIRDMTDAMKQNIYAGYDPAAVEMYENRLAEQRKPTGTGQQIKIPEDLNVRWEAIRKANPDMSREEIIQESVKAGLLPEGFTPPQENTPAPQVTPSVGETPPNAPTGLTPSGRGSRRSWGVR